jgi:hypothetical protein
VAVPLSTPDPRSFRRGDAGLALAAFAAAFALYARGAAPGIVPEGDCSEYVAAACVAGIPHAPGYPSYVLLAAGLARLVPADELARALNLVSAFFGAATVALIALLGARLARVTFEAAPGWLARGTGALAALLLATATEFWNQSLGAEVYTPSTFLLAACLVLLLGGAAPARLASAAFAAALAFGVHYTTAGPAALLVAVAAWWARAALGARGLARAAAAFALGLAPFLWLPLRSRADPALDFGDPETPAALWRLLTLADMPTGKAFTRELDVLAQQLGAVFGLAGEQWPPWVFALALLGLGVSAARRAARAPLAALVAVLVLDYAGILAMSNFALVPGEVYELRFLFLPAYLALALLGALGAAGATAFIARRTRALAPFVLALPALGLAPWVRARAHVLDKRADRVMREYGLGLLAAAEGPALLFTYGDNAWMPLVYLQAVERARPDVTVVAVGLLRHEWYRRQLAARAPELALPSGAFTPAVLARANAGRVHLYHADPRPQDFPGFAQVPNGLLMRLVPEGERPTPLVPLLPELTPGYAPLDLRGASLRAETANAYLRTAQWCRDHGAREESERAARAGLAIPLPEPRLADFHLVRAALWLELGDALAARGRVEEARAAWSAAREEGVRSAHVELAEKRLVASGGLTPGG